jgi:hypothetical protein
MHYMEGPNKRRTDSIRSALQNVNGSPEQHPWNGEGEASCRELRTESERTEVARQ